MDLWATTNHALTPPVTAIEHLFCGSNSAHAIWEGPKRSGLPHAAKEQEAYEMVECNICRPSDAFQLSLRLSKEVPWGLQILQATIS